MQIANFYLRLASGTIRDNGHSKFRSANILNEQQIALGAKYLQQGRLVAFPTETVYGLGANAWDATAVNRIFLAKGRPADNPLIVHIADYASLPLVVSQVPTEAERLMRTFWPGPLSIVLPKTERVPGIVTAGLATVAVRWPNHPVAEKLIRLAGLPIAAPSANRSGRPSPTLAEHVACDLGDKVDLILDAGLAAIGLESTVVDLSGKEPVLLRPGAVALEDLEKILGTVRVASSRPSPDQPVRSPGLKYTHYAPLAPLYLYLGEPSAVVQAQQARVEELVSVGKRVGVMTYDQYLACFPAAQKLSLGRYDRPAEAAQNLYQLLRRFDELEVDIILAHGYASTVGLGLALQNRLVKAAGFRLVWV